MASKLKVDIFHNVLWAKYKGDIFKELLAIADQQQVEINIFQIAETELSRVSLGKVNRDDHQYRYQLLFEGPYESIKPLSLWVRLFKLLVNSQSSIFVLPGYHRLEHWLMLLILKLRAKRVLVFCDSTALDNKKRFIKEVLKKFFFRAVDGVLCYGTASADYIRYYIPQHDYKKVYHPCSSASIPVEKFDIEQIQKQRSMLFKQSSKQFLFVGRLSPEKGLDDLVEAWAASDILRSYHQLKIAGDGPHRIQLQQKIKNLGINHSVQLLGARSKPELDHLYKHSYAMVLPSYSEPWGLVVNEAYYYGCPVILSEHCGCVADLCLDPQVQMMRTGDSNHLMKLMENFLNHSLYVELAVQAKVRISDFTPHSAANRIFSALTLENGVYISND